jgi:hypothetical protein
MDILDDLPVATLTYIAGIVLAVVGYVSNDINLQEAFIALGVLGGGTGAIGYVRNQAGKGVRHPKARER